MFTARGKTTVLLVLAVLTVASSAAAEKPSESIVRLQVPENFPTDMTTPLLGKLAGQRTSGRTWLLHRSGHEDIKAQRVPGTDKVVFIAHVPEGAAGSTLQFAADKLKAEPRLTVRKVDGGLRFFDGQRPVMFYHQQPVAQNGKQRRANYVHPLKGLGGETLTQDFPDDHPHHRGVFWAWHQVWVGEKRAGDNWVNRDFLSVVKNAEVLAEGPVFATLKLRVHWTSPRITDEDGRRRPLVEETTHIRLYRANRDTQCIDFTIRLKPLLPDVRIGGAENRKGYSGFTVRLRPPRDMQIREDDGLLDNDAVGRVSRWAHVSGDFGSEDAPSGMAILTHPSLPQFPPKWLLRHYGMQNVAFPGRHPLRLDAADPLVLRNRLVIHKGRAAEGRIADQQKAYELGW